MKLQIKNDNIMTANNNMTIQDKVNKIMGNETTSNKGLDNMKLKLKSNANNSPENSPLDNLKLKLKKSNGLNADNLEMSIDKFSKVKDIMDKLNSLDNTFTSFLDNSNDTIKVINNFSNRLDTFETIFTNIIKNQKSILNSINTLHGKIASNGNTFFDTSKETNNPEVKTIKAIDKKANTDNDKNPETIDGIFNIFQEHFNNNNFMGNKVLTPETMPIFQALIESIDIDNIDSITKSIGKFRSQLTKESGKYMTARKSNKAFDIAIIKTIETINGNPFDIAESKENSETIDKGYFAKIFKMDKTAISGLIDDIVSLDSIDESIELIGEIIKQSNPKANNNMIGMFINYVKAYMD